MKDKSKVFGSSTLCGQRGAVIMMVAILLVGFVGLAALSIDVNHLYMVQNELQNAADAGALAGARVLYNDEGTSVNEDANQEAYDAATANKALSSDNDEPTKPVDVHWTSGNTGDVQRGHWSFARKIFTPSDSLISISLSDVSTEDLDNMDGVNYTAPDGTNPVFINAVRVVARREDTPASSFFARIFGFEDFVLSADAVAYIGFAGQLNPLEANQPIAICKQSIINDDGSYTCNTGRMINSGGGTTNNTAGWTNFSQPCETAGPPSVRPLVCGEGNPGTLNFGAEMGTINGMTDNVYRDMRDCWMASGSTLDWRGFPTESWNLLLPVVDCPGGSPGPCSDLIGAVNVNVLWIKDSGTDSHWTDIPVQMEGWECSYWVNAGRPQPVNPNDLLTETQRQQCWQEFATTFNLYTADDTSVGGLSPSDLQKTMFFKPTCEVHEPAGVTGGENFGVLADIPVLVE